MTTQDPSSVYDILVVEDDARHQKAAEGLLVDHRITIVSTFDDAIDRIVGKDGMHYMTETKQHFDVLLTDLMFPQGRGVRQMDQKQAYEKMPFGYPLAIIAAKAGIKYIAVITDTNHHDHPMAYTLDHLTYNEKGLVAPIRVEVANVLFTGISDLERIYALKNGGFTTQQPEKWPPQPEELEKYAHIEGNSPVPVKNWKAALEKILLQNNS